MGLDSKIAVIGYDSEKRPFSVVTEDGDFYDIDHTKDGFLYHMSGGSAWNKYKYIHSTTWVDKPDLVTSEYDYVLIPNIVPSHDEDGSPIVTLADLERALDMQEVDGTIYCQVCDDRMDISPESLCDHIGWDDYAGDYAGCGQVDTEAISHKDSVIELVGLLGCKETIITLLQSGSRFGLSEYMGELSLSVDWSTKHEKELGEEQWEDVELGLVWINSLHGDGTEKYRKMTISWLQEENKPGKIPALPPL